MHAHRARRRKPRKDERKRGSKACFFHAARIEAVAKVYGREQEEHADHERRTQPAEGERHACKREQDRKDHARFVAARVLPHEGRADEQRAERGEHGEEPKPEGAHAENRRTERENIHAERPVDAFALVNIALSVGVTEAHFRNGGKRRAFARRIGIKAVIGGGRDIILPVQQRARGGRGFLGGLPHERRCGIHFRRHEAKLPRSLAVRIEFFAHERDFVDEQVAGARGEPDV